jgi:hypothetical protein
MWRRDNAVGGVPAIATHIWVYIVSQRHDFLAVPAFTPSDKHEDVFIVFKSMGCLSLFAQH